MIPVLNRNATYKLNIPDMAGGVNFRDGLSLINDNQMTDCKNMWYKDGMLKSRPRVLSNDNEDNLNYITWDLNAPLNAKINYSNIKVINGKQYALEVAEVTSQNEFTNVWEIRAAFVNGLNDRIPVAHIFKYGWLYKGMSCVAVAHNDDIYFYVHWEEKREDDKAFLQSFIVKAYKDESGNYVTEENVEGHVPLVLENGVPIGATETAPTQIEGFNLLSSEYKARYSTYDMTSNKDTNEMRYKLPVSISNLGFYGNTITATITDLQGATHKHTAWINTTIQKDRCIAIEDNPSTDNLRMYVDGDVVTFYNKDLTAVAVEKKGNYLKNNFEIVAPCYTEEEYQKNFSKVASMTQFAWYGNTSLGLNGGSRLFLGGSTIEKEKALVIWSDFENPLYFSENNYSYVGDKAQKVTAFGRQSASLIIFKEREIYSTQYTQGSVSAEELENQQAIDLTVHLATFPMVMICSQIGCNCPDSIQLCRNRLVWADTNGKIYTMTSQNQYSERNVFEIGEMVERELKKERLSDARSVDWEGHYILFVPESAKAYVMDYNSYGFANVASYNKQSDANMFIPFFVWQMPFESDELIQAVNLDGTVLFKTLRWLGNFPDNNGVRVSRNASNISILTEEITVDTLSFLEPTDETGKEFKMNTYERPVESMFKTKLFDFGRADEYKNVYAVNIGLGFNGGVPVAITFESDTRTSDKNTLKTGRTVADERTPVFFENKQILPYTRLCTKFGIKVECNGIMAVDSISLKYNIAGGKK